MIGRVLPGWRKAVLGLVFCCSGLTAAQVLGPVPRADSSLPSDAGQYKLSGAVVNSVTREPVAHALVQLLGAAPNSLLTDANGQFEFDGLSRSSLHVIVRKPGYFSEQEVTSGRMGYLASRVQIGPDTAPLLLKLFPAATVTGTVTGAGGEPLDQAQVRLLKAQVVAGRKRWQPSTSVQTDEDGRYRIGNLRPGTYLISVGAPDEVNLASFVRSQGYPLEWFFPGVSSRSAASPVELRPGQSFQADFTLREQPVYRLTGAVLRPPGTMGFSVQLAPVGGDPLNLPFRFLPNDHFEIPQVPAGNYTLEASAAEPGRQYSARLPLTVSSDVHGVVVALTPSPVIQVMVNTEFTRAETRTAQPQRPPFHLQLQQLDPPYNTQYAQAESPDNPGVQVNNLSPGRYLVEFPQNYGTYVQSATCGETDLLRDPLLVPSGAQAPPIVVNLRDDGATLIVKPGGAVPEAGAQVLAFPDDRPAQPPAMGFLPPSAQSLAAGVAVGAPFAPQAGAAQFRGLAPGQYTVLAFDRTDQLEYANPDVMRRYLPRAAHATLDANGSATVNVDVIRVGE